MPKRYSSKYIESVLLQYGFVLRSQKGSHKKFIKQTKTVIVPANKKELPNGTFAAIKRQSGLELCDFEKPSPKNM